MSRPVYRFAPSPNGDLHLGHAYSALLNQQMAEASKGRLLLRLEDTDQTRCKPEYAEGVLRDLAWLGLRWEQPVRVQSKHFDDYQANLETLWVIDAIYPCFCSRKKAAAHARSTVDPDSQPHYGGTCRSLSREQAASRIASGAVHGWRLNMQVFAGDDASVWGDALIAKRFVGSSYHIAVVTDDALQGVTHVVRGKDMEAATSIHMLLQRLLGLPAPSYHHHDLILDESGQKLSKSLASRSISSLRDAGATPDAIRKSLGFA